MDGPAIADLLNRLEKLEAQAVLFEQHRQEWIRLSEALAVDKALSESGNNF